MMGRSCRTLALAALLGGAWTGGAAAMERPAPVRSLLSPTNDPASAHARQRLIDERAPISASADVARFGMNPVNLASVLEEVDPRSMTRVVGDPLEFFANPEPSSLLVWSAAGMGLLASGYAYRRRRQPA